jgi:hypothetical protein
MKKAIFALFLLVLLTSSTGPQVTINKHWGDTPKTESQYDWSPVMVSPMGIKVIYTEKYGATKEVECIGLWEDKSNYLLTFRDSEAIKLEKANINGIEWTNK